MANLAKFNEAMALFKETRSDRSLSSSDECEHVTLDDERGSIICATCQKVLQESRLVVNDDAGSMQWRRRYTCTLFNAIPSFLSGKTRYVAIDLFCSMSRTARRKEDFLGCVFLAAATCGDVVSFDDLLETSNIKRRALRRGISRVSHRFQKGDDLHDRLDVMDASSILRDFGLVSQVSHVLVLIDLVRRHSDLLSRSHYKSIVFGCLFFWLAVVDRQNVTVDRLATKIGVSRATAKKKSFDVAIVVYRRLLKRMFSNLLSKCVTAPSDVRSPDEEDVLYVPSDELYVEHYDDPTRIRIRNERGLYLPIDDVDDIAEWNILLNTVLYDRNGYAFRLNIAMKLENKDVTFDCDEYDRDNRDDGRNIIANTVIDHVTSARII